MAGTPLAQAFVRVRADTSGFRREAERGINRDADAVGNNAGKHFGEGFGRGLTGNLGVQFQRAMRGTEVDAAVAGGVGGRAFGEAFTRDAAGRLRDGRGRFVTEGRQAGEGFGDGFGHGASSRLEAIRGSAFASVSGMQALISAGALIGPVIVPAAAAAAAAVAAIGPAAIAGIAGLGVVALAATGVAEAVKQMSAVEDQAAQSGASMAARQAAVAGAAERVRDAQRNLTFAEKDALAVRRELSQAQEEARRSLEDLAAQVRGNALDQRQGALDVADAQAELNRITDDPKATSQQRQQAQLNYERAVAQVEDLRRRGQRLAADQKAANKAGVEGSEQVRAVRERIAAADRRVADAQRAVVSAQRAAATAATQAAVGGTAAMRKLKDAMAALSPQGRTFATFLFGLRDEFGRLKRAAEAGLLPGVQAGITALLPYLPQIQKFIFRIGQALGGLAKSAGEALASPFWARFFSWLGTTAGPMLADLGAVVGGLARGFASLLMAFAPVSKDMVKGLAGLARGFADWAGSLSGTQGFKDFIAYVKENGPRLMALLGDFLLVSLKLAVALAPLGEIILRGLVKALDWLAKQDPGVVLGIAAAVTALVAALVGLAAGPVAAIGAITIAVVATVGALTYAYKNWEGFRRVVDTVARAYVTYVTAIWQASVRAFAAVSGAVEAAMRFIQPSLDRLNWLLRNVTGPTLVWLWRNVAVPMWQRIQAAFRIGVAAAQVALGLFQIGLKMSGNAIAALYRVFVKPYWDRIRPILSALGQVMKAQVAPAFKAGVDAVAKAWKGLENASKAPVRFVVNTVLNEGLLAAYNKLAKMFGVKPDNVKIGLPRGFARGGVLPGYTPGRDPHVFHSATGGTLALSGGEAILRPEATRALGKGWVDEINATARRGGVGGVRNAMGFADGGILGTLKTAGRKAAGIIGGVKDAVLDPGGTLRALGNRLLDAVPGANLEFGRLITQPLRRVVRSIAGKMTGLFGGVGRGVGRVGGGWPSSPSAQRGDSGVWRSILALVKASGIPYSFGNSYRHGDPLWHGSGRAIDFMGFNQDRLAAFFANMRPRVLELIHRTNTRDYGISRGQPHYMGEALLNAHRNHVHIAMAGGGLLGKLPFGSYDMGGFLPRGLSLAYNGTGAPEPVGHGIGGVHIHLHNHGVIGSQRELDNWLAAGIERVRRDRKVNV